MASMKAISRLIVIVISIICSSCCENEKESWEQDEFLNKTKHLMDEVRKLNPTAIQTIEQAFQKLQLHLINNKIKLEECKLESYFPKFICATNRIKACIETIWDNGNLINGVAQAELRDKLFIYYNLYEIRKKSSSCKIYDFLKFEEKHKFPKEQYNFHSAFKRPFAQWHCYLMNKNKTSIAENIITELKSCRLYVGKEYDGCVLEDFVYDFIFSLCKLHLLANFLYHEFIPSFSKLDDGPLDDLLALLNHQLKQQRVNKWYFPVKYLVHINIVLKCLNWQPLKYVYVDDGINILPQYDKCPRLV